MKSGILSHLFFVSLAIFALPFSGCTMVEFRYSEKELSADETAEITFVPSSCKTPGGLRRSSVTASPEDVKSFLVFAYSNGIFQTSAYSESSPTDAVLLLTKGKEYNLYAIANSGETDLPLSESDLQNFTIASGSVSTISTNGIPMVWQRKNFVAGGSTSIAASLTRLFAKLELNIDSSCYEGLHISSVKVRQANNKLSPFSTSGSKACSPEDVFDGDESSAQDIQSMYSGQSVCFYIPENLQGTLLASNTNPWAKTPSSIGAAAQVCTYLEVTASFEENHFMEGSNTYRLYLGKDNCSNFDISRNETLELELGLTRGGFNALSWKVTSDISLRDGFATGEYIGSRSVSELYVGEQFTYHLHLDKEVTDYLGEGIDDCAVVYSQDGTVLENILFGPISDCGSGSFTTVGTCYSQCLEPGEIWLIDSDEHKVATLDTDVIIYYPYLVCSTDMPTSGGQPGNSTTAITAAINSPGQKLYVYLTDELGNNLNAQGSNYQLDILNLQANLYAIDSRCTARCSSIRSYVSVSSQRGTSSSGGPALIVTADISNNGETDSACSSLTEALSLSQAGLSPFTIQVADLSLELERKISLKCEMQPVVVGLSEHDYISDEGGICLVVDNPSLLPLNVTCLEMIHSKNTGTAEDQEDGESTILFFASEGRTVKRDIVPLVAENVTTLESSALKHKDVYSNCSSFVVGAAPCCSSYSNADDYFVYNLSSENHDAMMAAFKADGYVLKDEADEYSGRGNLFDVSAYFSTTHPVDLTNIVSVRNFDTVTYPGEYLDYDTNGYIGQALFCGAQNISNTFLNSRIWQGMFSNFEFSAGYLSSFQYTKYDFIELKQANGALWGRIPDGSTTGNVRLQVSARSYGNNSVVGNIADGTLSPALTSEWQMVDDGSLMRAMNNVYSKTVNGANAKPVSVKLTVQPVFSYFANPVRFTGSLTDAPFYHNQDGCFYNVPVTADIVTLSYQKVWLD